MKRRKQYTMSEKRKLVDAKKANWSKRMRVVELHDEGLNFKQIGKLVGTSGWAASKLYKKAKAQLPQ